MGHKDLGIRNYNPSTAAKESKAGKSYLTKILKLTPYERLLYWIKERQQIHNNRFPKSFTSYLADEGNNPQVEFVTQPPWTDDPIFQTVFFCNAYRENDRVTAYLREHFREPYKDQSCVFLGSILLRWYNFIPTMQRLIKTNIPQSFGNPTTGSKARKTTTNSKGTNKGKSTNPYNGQPRAGWHLQPYLDLLLDLRDNQGEQLFGGAYIIRPIVDGKTGARKVESIGELMTAMAQCPTLYNELLSSPGIHPEAQIEPTERHMTTLGSTTTKAEPGTMAYAFARLNSFSGMGKFYCYQFIGDLAYTHVLREAPDWFTWGFCGPGTSRGLVRLKCPTGKATLPSGKRLPRLMPLQRGWQEQLLQLQHDVNRDLGLTTPTNKNRSCKMGGEVRQLQYIHMRDLCNCLCEYDKFERALFNERSIKRPYRGY